MAIMPEDEINISPKALVAVILVALSGNGALTYFSTRQENVRPDPFTGEMAEQMEHRLQEKIQANQRQLDLLSRDLKDMERRLIDCERNK